jgi:tetratricopeptide (TPR) repeat protein
MLAESPLRPRATLACLLLISLALTCSGCGRREGSAAATTAALPDAPEGEEKALLEALRASRPGDSTPARRLGDLYVDRARPFSALWAYAIATDGPPAPDPSVERGMARALAAGLFPEAAIRRLRAVVEREPREPHGVAALAELYLRTAQPEAALKVVEAAGDSFRGSEEGATLEGQARLALGDAAGAERALRRAVDLPHGKDPEAWRRLGLLALSRGDLFAAKQAFGAARVVAPLNPLYDVEYGRALAASANPKEQLEGLGYYVKAMNRSLRFAPAQYEAGVWYVRRKRWREAIARLRAAVDAEAGNPEAHEQLARALEAVGAKAEGRRHRALAFEARDLRARALQENQAWAALAPDDPEAELAVSESYFRMSDLPRARARLAAARKRFPNHPEFRERFIAVSIALGDLAPARPLLEAWLREEPASSRALWMQGRVAAEEQRPAEAIRLYEQAIARDPENPELHGVLGEALLKQPGSAERALEPLARAAMRAPAEARWRAGLAQALLSAGRVEEARRQALRALDLDPHQGEVYGVVVQLARRERTPGVLALFAQLTRDKETYLREETRRWRATWRSPEDAAAYVAMADFLARGGDLAAAEGQLAEAVRLRPGDTALRARLSRVGRLLALR